MARRRRRSSRPACSRRWRSRRERPRSRSSGCRGSRPATRCSASRRANSCANAPTPGCASRAVACTARRYFALDAGVAQAFLVAVDRDRIALVPRDTAGLGVTPLTTIDRTRRVAELVFEGTTPAEWIGGRDGVSGIADRVLAAGRIALAADILGACERAIEMAVAYAKQREQFGRPIATFQAVKHLCAEMVAELEPARSLVWYAAYAFDERPEEASLLALHAKAHFAEIGTFIVRTATEVHGGIGFTDAYDLQLWFKRVGLDRQLLGNPELLRAEAANLQFG